MKAGFVDKLLERLGRVNPEEVQTYLLRLVREKGFLEQIFNALQEGILVVGTDGRIVYVNQAACDLFGLDPAEAPGKLLADKVRGLDWNEFATGDGIVSRDMEVFYPRNRFLNFYVVPLQPSADASPARAIILRDITDSRKTTEQTIESERFSALTLLAAGVAHELGNPLNSLHIHLQLLERKARKLPAQERRAFAEDLQVAKDEITRLDSIVNQFLRAIRPTTPNLQPSDLNALVRESIDFLASEIKDRDILVEQELHSGVPLVDMDRDQMKQAFFNIIKNAFQAMKTGGILRIATGLEDEHAVIRFADSGGGISPENMGKLFRPYFTTKTSGSGLGLLIVRRIVREHGGEISVESHEGAGVTLTIRLPLLNRHIRLLEG